MKYYLNGWNWSNEISKQRFYSLRRSNKWHEKASFNGGVCVARKLTLKK